MIFGFQEDFLHFIWRYKYFDTKNLATTTGAPLVLMYGGEAHSDSGPDFRNALVRIDETVWAGHVELHIRSSDWHRHRHHQNVAYDNVVLHVVYVDDAPIVRTDGSLVPCLVLENRISPSLLEHYTSLQEETHPIPCHRLWADVPNVHKNTWISRLSIERLEAKTAYFASLQAVQNNHWEEAFYQALARSFGGNLNGEPFEQLARSLPNAILAKNKHSLKSVEALIFGQAGMFENVVFTDEYPQILQKEYQFLQKKYQLSPINAHAWRFSRLRPPNFPTIRLAQFARLVYQSVHLWSKIMEISALETARGLFAVSVSDYWQTHYIWDKPTTERQKNFGTDAINLLFINTIIPFLFLYGGLRNDAAMQEKALAWLEAMPAEQNHIIAEWSALGSEAQNAAESQALLHLYKNYCTPKRCLNCAIGVHLLK